MASRKHRLPWRLANGFVSSAAEGRSLDVTAVSPLEFVVSDILLERPAWSPRAAAAARASADCRTFRRSVLLPEFEEDFRWAWACALPLFV